MQLIAAHGTELGRHPHSPLSVAGEELHARRRLPEHEVGEAVLVEVCADELDRRARDVAEGQRGDEGSGPVAEHHHPLARSERQADGGVELSVLVEVGQRQGRGHPELGGGSRGEAPLAVAEEGLELVLGVEVAGLHQVRAPVAIGVPDLKIAGGQDPVDEKRLGEPPMAVVEDGSDMDTAEGQVGVAVGVQVAGAQVLHLEGVGRHQGLEERAFLRRQRELGGWAGREGAQGEQGGRGRWQGGSGKTHGAGSR